LPAKAASLALQCSSCTQTSGTAVHESMVGSHARRVKLFSAAPRIFRAPRAASLVMTVLPSASRPKTSWPPTNSTLISALSFCTCHAGENAPHGVCAGNGRFLTTRSTTITPGSFPADIYLMISSASIKRCGGIVIPSACAVLRLITSSNLVGCSTGRSPGFAPFKILST
jgi:hypothetical protein